MYQIQICTYPVRIVIVSMHYQYFVILPLHDIIEQGYPDNIQIFIHRNLILKKFIQYLRYIFFLFFFFFFFL